MSILKWAGYILVSAVALTILVIGSTLLAVLLFGGGIVLFTIVVIVFIAYCIKDYCESVSARSRK